MGLEPPSAKSEKRDSQTLPLPTNLRLPPLTTPMPPLTTPNQSDGASQPSYTKSMSVGFLIKSAFMSLSFFCSETHSSKKTPVVHPGRTSHLDLDLDMADRSNEILNGGAIQ